MVDISKVMKFVVYKITCTCNNKIYIGSASNYGKRIGSHLACLRRNKHDSQYMQNSYNKYGESSFKFEIVEYCTKETLIEREQYWIDTLKCFDSNVGFNSAKIAGSKLGVPMPQKAKDKIRSFQKSRIITSAVRKKMTEGAIKAFGKPIYQYDKAGNFIAEYKSISEASRITGISISSISVYLSKKLTGRFKTRRSKYHFKYKDIV